MASTDLGEKRLNTEHTGGRPHTADREQLKSSDGQPAYRLIAEALRAEVLAGHYTETEQGLPTEAQLMELYGVGRQTARRAYQVLADEGIIYRVRGRGTFAHAPDRWPLRSLGVAEEVLSQSSTLEIDQPPTLISSPMAARELELDDPEVYLIKLRRSHGGLPFVHAECYFRPDAGKMLAAIPRVANPVRGSRFTILSALADRWPQPLIGVKQTALPVAISADLAEKLDCTPGEPVLVLHRIYYDATWTPVEFSVDTFNPHRFRYQFSLRQTP